MLLLSYMQHDEGCFVILGFNKLGLDLYERMKVALIVFGHLGAAELHDWLKKTHLWYIIALQRY